MVLYSSSKDACSTKIHCDEPLIIKGKRWIEEYCCPLWLLPCQYWWWCPVEALCPKETCKQIQTQGWHWYWQGVNGAISLHLMHLKMLSLHSRNDKCLSRDYTQYLLSPGMMSGPPEQENSPHQNPTPPITRVCTTTHHLSTQIYIQKGVLLEYEQKTPKELIF